jgi:hypothetical protein
MVHWSLSWDMQQCNVPGRWSIIGAFVNQPGVSRRYQSLLNGLLGVVMDLHQLQTNHQSVDLGKLIVYRQMTFYK